MKKKLVFITLTLLSFTSCSTLGENRKVKVFFIDQGKLQYFFPNTSWKGEEGTPSFEGDWLFRSYALEGEKESRTIFNFSLIYDKLKMGNRPLDSLYVVCEDGKSFEVQDRRILFKNESRDRYTCWISSENFSDFMTSGNNPQLTLIFGEEEYYLIPTPAFRDHLRYFRQVNPEYQ